MSEQRRYVTDFWVIMAESSGVEIPVTLVVAGTVIEGSLCPEATVREWAQEVIRRVALGEGNKLPTTVPGPSMKDMERARDRWEAGMLSGEIPSDGPVVFPIVGLRNATVRTGSVPMNWTAHPFLLVDAEHIGAISIGHSG